MPHNLLTQAMIIDPLRAEFRENRSVCLHLVSFRHCSDVITSTMASQITGLTIVYSTAYSGVDQRKHQRSASLAFVRGIHRWPVNSPHRGPVTRKIFPYYDAIVAKLRWHRLLKSSPTQWHMYHTPPILDLVMDHANTILFASPGQQQRCYWPCFRGICQSWLPWLRLIELLLPMSDYE